MGGCNFPEHHGGGGDGVAVPVMLLILVVCMAMAGAIMRALSDALLIFGLIVGGAAGLATVAGAVLIARRLRRNYLAEQAELAEPLTGRTIAPGSVPGVTRGPVRAALSRPPQALSRGPQALSPASRRPVRRNQGKR